MISRFAVALLLSAAIVPFASIEAAYAQDEAATETEDVSPELQALLERQKIAEAEQAISAARLEKSKTDAARIAALLPSSETTGVDGSITADDKAGYYAEVMAYAALNDAAKSVACKVKSLTSSGTKPVIFVDAATYPGLARVHARLDSQITAATNMLNSLSTDANITEFARDDGDDLFQQFGNFPEPDGMDGPVVAVGPAAVIAAIPGVLGVARDIAKFFQTELTIAGRDVTIDEEALETAMIGHLLADGVTVKSMGPVTAGAARSDLISDHQKMRDGRDKLAAMKRQIESNAKLRTAQIEVDKALWDKRLETSEAAYQEAKKTGQGVRSRKRDRDAAAARVTFYAKEIARVEAQRAILVLELDTVITAADTLTTGLMTTNDAGTAPIDTIALIDLIDQTTDPVLVSVNILNRGAELQMTKKAFAGNVNYVGGVIVNYRTMNKAGMTTAAGQFGRTKAKTFKRKQPIAGMEANLPEFASTAGC